VSSTKERGVLLLIDEAFIDRLDRETAIVEAAQVVPQGKKRPKVARTAVMREMLRTELDRRALARGEAVPTVEPVTFTYQDEDRETVSGAGEGGSIPDAGDVPDDQGDVEEAEEGNGVDGAAALTAETGPPPERVTPGRIRGTIRKVGVRSKA
jgi:hypothetical protein